MSEINKINDNLSKPSSSSKLPKSILVVEDDRTHRAMIEKILRPTEFNVAQAENGIVALSKIDAGYHFDLILMDWDMPELNGLETVKAIRSREVSYGSPHTPVIAFTSNREPGDREKCLAAGMDAYLPKDVWTPKWRDTLINNLQDLIAGKFDIQDFGNNARPQPASGSIAFDLRAFDMQALEQTASLLKNDLHIAIEEYLEDASAYIRDIKEGLDSEDSEKSARGSHPLKSNSKGFGLVAVSQIAEAINIASRSGDLEAVKFLFPQLQDAFCLAEKKLHEVLKCTNY